MAGENYIELSENLSPEGQRTNTDVQIAVKRVKDDRSNLGVEAIRIGVTEKTLKDIVDSEDGTK